jgi:hypothetical protein
MVTDAGRGRGDGPGQRATHDESATEQTREARTQGARFDCWECCTGWAGTDRHSGIRLGILLIVVGLLWFGRTVGWLQPDYVWPLFIAIIGIWIIFPHLVRRKRKT